MWAGGSENVVGVVWRDETTERTTFTPLPADSTALHMHVHAVTEQPSTVYTPGTRVFDASQCCGCAKERRPHDLCATFCMVQEPSCIITKMLHDDPSRRPGAAPHTPVALSALCCASGCSVEFEVLPS